MRMSVTLPVAAAIAAAVIGISTPAAATDLKGALALCNKTGGCDVRGTPGVGVNIKYGNNEIFCPYGGGKCECIACAPPKRTQDANDGTVFGGGGVLSQSTPGKPSSAPAGGVLAHSGGTPKNKPSHEPKPTPSSEPKPVPTAEPKPTPTPTPAKPTVNVRDHRGTNGGGGVTVTTTRPTYDGTGTSEKRRPEIRDHRAKPEVRDHRAGKTASSQPAPKSNLPTP